jgi:hypothetical protein
MQEQETDTHGMEEELSAMIDYGRREVVSFVRARPHAAIGIAAAFGFILGGGLTPRRLLRLGFMVGGPAVSRQLMGQAADWVANTISPRIGATQAGG